MLDIKTILNDPERVRDSIHKRGVKDELEALLALNAERKSLMTEIESHRAEANKNAKAIPTVGAEQRPGLIEKGRELNHAISLMDAKLQTVEQAYQETMLGIPNFLPEDTPLGASDAENVVLREHLTPTRFDFEPKDHLEIGKSLDLLDFETAAKVTGSKFYFLKNEAVFLELALKLFVLNLVADFGYTPLITPDLAKKSILSGTGFAPRGEESNIYHVEGMDLGLIATAEITVGGMHADEILQAESLPLRYVAESHCFRREAGAGGKENKGLYRVHQFSKIELFQITTPEKSEEALNEILRIEETIYQKLELPYRVVRICAGDLGAAAFKKYDIEAWMPGRESADKYGEVTSASNCTDFQSRRLNIRYHTKDKQRIFPHTLNGTAIALSRTLMAILENYQQRDGRVSIPKVLQAYIGKEWIGPALRDHDTRIMEQE